MTDTWQRAFLEPRAYRTSVRRGGRRRAAARAAAAAGSVAVVYAGLALGPPSGASPLVLTLVTLAHLLFLQLAVRRLAFHGPQTRLGPQGVAIPIALGLGYVALGTAAGLRDDPPVANGLLLVGTLLFALAFLWWTGRSLAARSLPHEGLSRSPAAGVVVLNAALATLLLVESARLATAIAARPGAPPAWGWDAGISLAVLAWLALTPALTILRRARGAPDFGRVYEDYRARNVAEPGPVPVRREDLLGDGARILDYGSGSGHRLLDLLGWIGQPLDDPSLAIDAYDTFAGWEDLVAPEIRGAARFRFLSDPAGLRPAEYDLVHLSHVLYVGAERIARDLAGLRPGAIVVVRGVSSRSFLYLASLYESDRSFAPPFGHYWMDGPLPGLIDRLDLEPLSGAPGPDLRVRQRLRISDGGALAAARFLRHLYGEDVGAKALRYLTDLRDRAGVDEIPNDDLVFVFRKR